jgi:hypothetical protein
MHDHRIVIVVVKRYAVELQKGICKLASWCCHARIQRHAFEMAGWTGASNVHTATVFYCSEIHSVESPTLMRYHGRLHVSEESPCDRSEEGMVLDI